MRVERRAGREQSVGQEELPAGPSESGAPEKRGESTDPSLGVQREGRDIRGVDNSQKPSGMPSDGPVHHHAFPVVESAFGEAGCSVTGVGKWGYPTV